MIDTPQGGSADSLPGLGFLGTTAEAGRQAFLMLLGNRLLWLLLVAEVALAAFAYVVGGVAQSRLDGRQLFCLFAWWMLAGVLLPWSSLHLAVEAVHGEIEDRTYQYLFLRPVSRAALLLGKWLAVTVLASGVGLFGGGMVFLAVAARAELWPAGVDWQLAHGFAELLLLGAVAYAAVGVCFAAACRRPLVWAAMAVMLQMVIALLPVSAAIRRLTVSDPLRRMVLDRVDPNPRLAEMLWPGERDFRGDLIGRPVTELSILITLVLAFGVIRYRCSEYDSRSRT